MYTTFFGAAHEVTGSCHLIETHTKKILFDCGMFQGGDFNEAKNHDPFPFDPAMIDAVCVSHAHLDHTGRIPKLVKEGFRGAIYGTKATCEFMRLIWNDAYKIMAHEYKKFGSPILYDEADIETAIARCRGVSYHETVTIDNDITVVFKDAGHIFGSSFIELSAEGKKIAFSGDIGNKNVPILRETEPLPALDVLLCESTYGDRVHETEEERKRILLKVISEGVARGGTIMMPAFSLERTQEILYMLDELSEKDETLPKIPIFLDSPMAIDALETYKKYKEYYDEDACKKVMRGNDFLNFPELRITRSVDESKEINDVPGPKMVIAGAGMMNGGRILHHALRYLSDPASTLILVGYQADGTLGRRLYEGATSVQIFRQRIPVRCTVKAIGALSAHADQSKLIDWIGSGSTLPKQIYFVHGESHAATELAHRVRDRYGVQTYVPIYGERCEV